MDQELQQVWDRLLGSVSVAQNFSALTMALHMLLAGGLGLYLRMLFRRSSISASDADAIARVFPLLAVVTTGVIAVVKSSLALSLGLVGALSIVRFRSAIKEPEELVYLFLCVAVGLALGAELPMLALVLVATSTVVALVMYWQGRCGHGQGLLLTISGDAESDFGEGEDSVFTAVSDLVGPHALQRVDLEDGRGQMRLLVRRTDTRRAAQLIRQLRGRLPNCDFSYVNLNQ